MTRDSRESPLSRWSRRKLEAEQALEAETQPVARAEIASGDLPAEAPAPVLTDADMPAIDTLSDESDFSPFMSPGVSDELRNLALRKLFGSPVFNIRDGLDEYDDDFTEFAKLGDIVTSDMKHRIEMEQQKLREKLASGETGEGAAEEAGRDAVEAEIDADLDEESAAADAGPKSVARGEPNDEQS